MKKFGYVLAIIVLVFVAGCSSQMAGTPTETMMGTPTADMMMDTATPDTMMGTPTPDMMMDSATPDSMMGTPTADMMMDTATPDSMMGTQDTMLESPTVDTMMQEGTPPVMMATDSLLSTSLKDTATGSSFKLSDYSGKIILVELISTKCPACLEQQQSIQAYQMGAGKDVVVVSLDIVATETSADLQDHLGMTTFHWSFASAPADLISEIGAQFGSQYIDPANTPLLVVDQMGDVHALPLNLTSEDAISNALSSYVPGM